MFGLFKRDEQLGLQREFHRNCVEQIEDLERRISDKELAALRATFSAVWIDDQPTRELPGKVQLARSYATELGGVLAGRSSALASMWPALDELQAVIDNCERAVQDLLAGLLVRQGSSSPANPIDR